MPSEISPYANLGGIVWLEEQLDEAIQDCARVGVVINDEPLTRRQNAILQLVPNGMSFAQSILSLVRSGYLPSAHALLRPLFEYTSISSLVESHDEWLSSP